VGSDKSKHDAYTSLVGAVNGVLARDLQGVCSNKLNPNAPNRTDLLKLNDCLNSEWLPL